MTTKDAIKLLPIDEKVKVQILNLYDHMEPAKKLTVQRIAWKMYDLARLDKIDADIQREYDEVKKGQAELGGNFYKNVVKKANQELQQDISGSSQQTDLAAARRAMEQIINEIRSPKSKNSKRN